MQTIQHNKILVTLGEETSKQVHLVKSLYIHNLAVSFTEDARGSIQLPLTFLYDVPNSAIGYMLSPYVTIWVHNKTLKSEGVVMRQNVDECDFLLSVIISHVRGIFRQIARKLKRDAPDYTLFSDEYFVDAALNSVCNTYNTNYIVLHSLLDMNQEVGILRGI